jgi:type 1 glutamine amidotransferase
MTGGQFVAHPGGCIPSHRIDILDPDHPVTQGIEGFEIPDSEQYYMHVDPGVNVLCTTTFTGEHGDTDLYPAGTVMPYVWTRWWGKGKVFVACWGHTEKDFDVPEAREIMGRGMLWASR